MVEGAVLRAQESLSANVQLVDPVTGTHLLAETVQLDPGRLFAQQATLARRIATSLLAGKEAPVTSAPQREVDPEAMNHYLLGRFHWYKLDPAHFPEALRHFESAIAIDPGFSAAHAGIADVWGAFGYWGVMPATEVRDKVWASTEKALQHDPLSAEAHMLAGAYWLFVEHDWSAAQASLEKAMDLNPSLAHAHLLYGLFLGTTGGGDARTHFATAQQLDPLNPAMHFGAAICAAAGNRLDDAARWVERSLELEPGFRPGLELRADLAWRAGNADALEFERALWPADQDVSRTLAPGAGVSASEQLAGSAAVLERRSRKQYVSPRVIARLYGLATNTAKAIDVLARAIDAADLMQPDLVCMMPAFEDVRQDRRFSDLRARLGLRPYRS